MSEKDRRRHYDGQTDALNLRFGRGVQKFPKKEGDETYLGRFKRDVYHGPGQYLARNIFTEPWSYEGMFNANRLEGYGVLSFASKSIFSGLYKNNRPFGPGVLTYPDGRQDVGLWIGSQLVRICTPVGFVESLCKTQRDRIAAMKYKKLVPIEQNINDIAKNIMMEMNANPELLSQAHKLYSRHCKNPASNLYDHKEMQDDLSDLRNVEEDLIELEQSKGIDVGIDTYGIDTEIVNVRPGVDSKDSKERCNITTEEILIAWNNQNNIIEIMKHSFKHRMQEKEIQFSLKDVICSRRTIFAREGDKEKACIEMLLASGKNDSRTILNLLKKYQLNVDVMDHRGNSMILIAAANDAHNVIRMLSEVYCDMDAVNDEGFNSLNHTLTRYLAILYDIKNWGKGFVCPFDLPEHKGGIEWLVGCLRSPSPTIPTKKNKKSPTRTESLSNNVSGSDDDTTKYLFHLRRQVRKISKPKSKGKLQNSETSQGLKSPSKPRKLSLDEIHLVELEILKQEKLTVIEETIQLLLDLGVDVNVSVTPAPLWVLALFAGNVAIIEKLLQLGADPNEKLLIDKGILTPLHIVVLAKITKTSPRIAELLLQHGANTHSRANADYWRELSMFLNDYGNPHQLLEGMNPLHALILRPYDDIAQNQKYLEDLGCLIAWNTSEEELFLGLTPLGLAIAKGNYLMILILLQCAKVLINKKFDEFWGNPLTTYVRTQGTNSDFDAYKILECLLHFGADPLEPNVSSGGGNVINFISRYKQKLFGSTDAKTTAAGEQQKKAKSTNTDKKKLMTFEAKEAILKNLAKIKVEKYIQGLLVRNVLNCMQKVLSDNENLEEIFSRTMEHIGNWITFEELPDLILKNLKVVEFTNGMALAHGLQMFPEMFPNDPPPDIPKRRSPPQSRLAARKSIMKELGLDHLEDYRYSLNEWAQDLKNKLTEIKGITRLHNYSKRLPPEIDKNENLYKVCYECLKRSHHNVLCPKCQLVYFCSVDCNINDVNNPLSRHKCNLVYWGLEEGEEFLYGVTPAASEQSIESKRSESSKKNRSTVSFSRRSTGASYLTEEESIKRLRKKSKDQKKLKLKVSKLLQNVLASETKITSGSKRKSKKTKKTKQVKNAKDQKTMKSKSMAARKQKTKMFKLTPGAGKSNKNRRHSYDVDEKSRKSLFSGMEDELNQLENKLLLYNQSILEEKSKLTSKESSVIDYKALGGKAEQEEFWEREEETKYSVEQRLEYFLRLLYKRFGDTFDIDNYFPFIIYRNEKLYYKSYKRDENVILENYSFN